MKKVALGLNGRIVIPKSIRKEMNISEGSPLIITFEDGAIIVRPNQIICKLCASPLESERNFQLCDKCIDDILKYHSSNCSK